MDNIAIIWEYLGLKITLEIEFSWGLYLTIGFNSIVELLNLFGSSYSSIKELLVINKTYGYFWFNSNKLKTIFNLKYSFSLGFFFFQIIKFY